MLEFEMSRAVVRGYLPAWQAEAAIIVRAARRTREAGRDLADAIAIDQHILHCAIDQAETRADLAQAAIVRAVRWLASRRARSNVILAEARDCNALHGSPLTECQVRTIAEDALRAHMRGAA